MTGPDIFEIINSPIINTRAWMNINATLDVVTMHKLAKTIPGHSVIYMNYVVNCIISYGTFVFILDVLYWTVIFITQGVINIYKYNLCATQRLKCIQYLPIRNNATV